MRETRSPKLVETEKELIKQKEAFHKSKNTEEVNAGKMTPIKNGKELLRGSYKITSEKQKWKEGKK